MLNHIVPAIGKRKLKDIMEIDLQNLLNKISNSTYGPNNKRYSKKTVKEVRSVLFSLFETAKNNRLTPHYLRHNYCTLLYDSGVDVQTAKVFMGHSKIETTMEIYTHCSESRQIKSSEKIINI